MFGSWGTYFSAPIRPSCSTADPSVTCDSRRVAERTGEFRWVPGTPVVAEGWAFPVSFPAWAPRFRWTYCPFCDVELPRVPYATPQADGEGPEA